MDFLIKCFSIHFVEPLSYGDKIGKTLVKKENTGENGKR